MNVNDIASECVSRPIFVAANWGMHWITSGTPSHPHTHELLASPFECTPGVGISSVKANMPFISKKRNSFRPSGWPVASWSGWRKTSKSYSRDSCACPSKRGTTWYWTAYCFKTETLIDTKLQRVFHVSLVHARAKTRHHHILNFELFRKQNRSPTQNFKEFFTCPLCMPGKSAASQNTLPCGNHWNAD